MVDVGELARFTPGERTLRLVVDIAAALERYRIVMEGPAGVRLRKLNHIRTINYEVADGVVTKCEIVGGCPGNTQGVAKLVVGRKVEEVVALLKGIQCRNGTSCPD